MPTLELQHSILRYIQNLNETQHNPEDWSDWLPRIGCPVDNNDETVVELEVFPDRPDLLSHETLAKASRSFLAQGGDGVAMGVLDGDIEMNVDPSLREVRPVIMAAVVRNVDTGSDAEQKSGFIQSLMDHQEKLHLTLGRKRRFSSIGVHDLSSLSPPFRVITVPPSYSFVPLAETEKMSIGQILENHPKGIEYSHLMSELDRFPVILDSNDDLLSFPPIINGDHTTVNEKTTDFFIDVTGWDERACEACLLLICLSLAERGGLVESVLVTGCDGNSISTPRGDERQHRVPDRLIRSILGLEMSAEVLSEALTRMGGRLDESRTVTDGPNKSERWGDCAVGEQEHIVSMPRWRSDIMHPIDIVEDIAIGYGYENLPKEMSSVHIDAVPLQSSHLKRRFSESMRACGLQEIQSLTLSNEADQFELTRWPEGGSRTTIANPITSEHTMLRQFILPSLLRLLAANRHHELPQRVYELGSVVRDSRNRDRGAWACAEVGSGFSTAKGIVQGILRDLGAPANEVDFIATAPNVGPWITGRGSSVTVRGQAVGEFGEIDPLISSAFGLKSPIHAGEFDLGALGELIPDPVI
ncbi:MAG: phenylalanine--tRNA ligase subunit beta [Candidatus Thalassarchaeaceae archaeon]|nr:phenylalanine--tRNA ligase subunit beta [Candidatus Thalassarchaeaceae archaeon]MDP7004307.1 phenylalanine--tRNA ligase subunit beta [Candidatus Thalassarchaeaceae archaeon]